MMRISVAMWLGFGLQACAPAIMEKAPPGGELPYNQVVYVKNDGRCKNGEVMKLTGGNNYRNIPRKYECVDPP